MKKIIFSALILVAVSCKKDNSESVKKSTIRTFEIQVEEVNQDGTTTISGPVIIKFKI